MSFIAAAMLSASITCANDSAPAPGRQNMRRAGFRQPMRNPMMSVIRKVAKELKAYQAKPTPENFAAFEKAFNEAVKADTARKKANLEKQLAELEKTQAERAKDILAKVKSGEFKMPERPQRGNHFRPMRGKKGKPPTE